MVNRYRADLELSDFGLDPKGQKSRMARIAEIILSAWKAKANGHSDRTRSAYKKSLTARSDSRVAEVTFKADGGRDSILALMVEYGMGPGGIGTEGQYDVRKFLLRGGRGKMRSGKSGPTKVVPFSHRKASVSAMGGRALSDKVSSAAFKASVEGGQQKTVWGHTIKSFELPGPLRAQNVTKVDVKGKTYTAFRHKVHVLTGAVKRASTYTKGVSQTSGVTTFRTASWEGDPWMHPGIKARHYGEEIWKDLPTLLAGMI